MTAVASTDEFTVGTQDVVVEAGAIFVDGVDISTLSMAELYQLRQRFGMEKAADAIEEIVGRNA